MTRVVRFDGEKGAKRFELCLVALLRAGDGKGERSRDRIRREARVFTALDAISDPAPMKDNENARALKAGEHSLTISQEDFAMIENYLDTTPWTPIASRDAVDVQDWWSAAEKVEA